MGLFDFLKKKTVEEEECGCCCGGSCDDSASEEECGCGCDGGCADGCCADESSLDEALEEAEVVASSDEIIEDQTVKILGSGCTSCNNLEANVKEALTLLGRSTDVEHVIDFGVIASYGVMQTPALVLGNKVLSYGKVLKVEEAKQLLEKNLL